MAMYLGELRGGLPGLIAAGVSFILPAAVLVALLAWAYVKFGSVAQMQGLLSGIKPVVIALILQPMWDLRIPRSRTVSSRSLPLPWSSSLPWDFRCWCCC